MKLSKLFSACLVGIMFLPVTLSASDYGTADEARAMLEQAVMALKKNPIQALTDFTEGKEPYKEKDLYVFCFDMQTEQIIAHGDNTSLIGNELKCMQDKTGKKYGQEWKENAIEGEFREVNYFWPRITGAIESSQKSSYITRVGDIACGVGYYK